MTHSFHPTLLALAAHGLKGTLHQLPSKPLSPEQWDVVFGQVRAHRLSGQLVDAIESNAMPVTERQRREANNAHIVAMTGVLVLENFLINSTQLLAEAGIRVRVLKGSAVARLDYADPALRPFVDIDLLVESGAFDSATQRLRAAGHRRYFAEICAGFDRRFGKGVSLVSRDGLQLDLHRTFAMGPFGLTIDLDDLWASRQDFSLAGITLSALGAEERFLHACYHASLGDYPPRLLPHRDVAEMLLYGDRDEGRMLELSQRWGGEAVVARAVSTAWELFDIADVTAMSAWASRYRTDPKDSARLAVYTDGNTSYSAKTLASIRALPRLRDRAAMVRMLASPGAEFMSRRDRGRVQWIVDSLKRGTERPSRS